MLAVALCGVAYGISLPLTKFAEDQDPKVENQFNDLRRQFADYKWYQDNEKYHGNNIVEIIMAGVLWFVMMGIAMFVVSAALAGTDPDRQALKDMPVSPANKKAMIKQMKKDLKDAKRRAKEMEKRKK